MLAEAINQLNERDEDDDREVDIDLANALTAEDDDDDQSVISDASESESTYMQDMAVDEADEKLINMFIAGSKKNLSDIIAQNMRGEDAPQSM